MNKMVEEERRQPRPPLFGVAEINAGNHGRSFFCTALTQNISLSGMGLYMHHPLKEGTRVSITIRFNVKDCRRPADTIAGIVTSVSEMDSFYCIGVRFNTPLRAEDQPNLYPHLISGADEAAR